jgi:hypothetical protein
MMQYYIFKVIFCIKNAKIPFNTIYPSKKSSSRTQIWRHCASNPAVVAGVAAIGAVYGLYEEVAEWDVWGSGC